MKRVVTVLAAFFCGIIVFFTFFGEKLFYSTKPHVEIARPQRINDLIILPETAVFHDADGDYIFTITAEEGFSAQLLTATKVRLTRCVPDETGYFGVGYVSVAAEGYSGALTVVRANSEPRDGERVVEGE